MPHSSRKRVILTGASGVVGRHLVDAVLRRGWEVSVLTVSGANVLPSGVRKIKWDPKAAAGGDSKALDTIARALDGTDWLVNLAGETLGSGRLDGKHKKRVMQSRLDAGNALHSARLACPNPPMVWTQASATGFYGDTGEADVYETAPAGKHFFLADVCKAWEGAATQALDAPKAPRVIVARLGLVLAKDAPAWEKMLLPIKIGAGGPLGSGKQWYAWIDADEAAEAMIFLFEKSDASGVYNFTTPEPIRQIDMTKQTAEAIGRPSYFPAPAFALRLAVGGVADALLLPSCRALPDRLAKAGYPFKTTDFEDELPKLV
ncbi:TIGR01777 family oxidoreductase [bacterium]|nr:TIGR01777 family oxidoreductase [bacterium]